MTIRSGLRKNGMALTALALLVLLPGCAMLDWVKDKMGGGRQVTNQSFDQGMIEDDSAVVVSIAGEPLITQERLAREKHDVVESNPQLKAMLALMDEKQLERNLVEGLTNQEVVARYVKDKGLADKSEYQEELDRAIRSVTQMLNVKYFSQEFPVAVGDSDAKSFYDKNKDSMPQLLLSRGGIHAKGVSFETKEAAQDFVALVNKSGDLEKAAQVADVSDKVKDFKIVHANSLGIDTELRDRIAQMTAVPAAKVCSLKDGSHWAVYASSKEDSQYRPFEQVKADLKQYLEKEKRVERFDQEIGRLKQEYRIVINEDYFAAVESPNGDVAVASADESQQDQPAESVEPTAGSVARSA